MQVSDTVEPLLWDTSIKGTPPFRGHKIFSRKNVHITIVIVTSFQGTPLFKGKGHFSGSQNPDLTSIQEKHFISAQKVTDH